MPNARRFVLLVLVTVLTCHVVLPQQMRDSFRRVKSAVVIVHCSHVAGSAAPAVEDDDEEDLGSGVLISADGKILTAAHVVAKQTEIKVEFANGERRLAHIIASSSLADLALLQVDRVPSMATPVKLGDSDAVETGDDIFIVGAPYGLSYTLTIGRVSARRPDEARGGILSTVEFLQTDAVINPGNSGGPVFNKDGEVVGIVSSIISDSEEFRGVGFAATANAARSLFLENDSSRSGVEGVLVTGVIAKALNLPQAAGFIVTNVIRDSLAERMGLRGGEVEATIDDDKLQLGGDVILDINGITVGSNRRGLRTIYSSIGGAKAGSMVRCRVMREGKIVELSLKVPPAPAR